MSDIFIAPHFVKKNDLAIIMLGLKKDKYLLEDKFWENTIRNAMNIMLRDKNIDLDSTKIKVNLSNAVYNICCKTNSNPQYVTRYFWNRLAHFEGMKDLLVDLVLFKRNKTLRPVIKVYKIADATIKVLVLNHTYKNYIKFRKELTQVLFSFYTEPEKRNSLGRDLKRMLPKNGRYNFDIEVNYKCPEIDEVLANCTDTLVSNDSFIISESNSLDKIVSKINAMNALQRKKLYSFLIDLMMQKKGMK